MPFSNKASSQPKTTPLETCLRALAWAADSAFENAVGALMVSFMNHGREEHPELQAQVQRLIDQRLEVTRFSEVIAALAPVAQTQR